MSQEVSDEEIAREFRTLRNLRRRSGSATGPGALPLDPDLPPPSPSGSSGSSSTASSSFPSYSSNDDITLSSSDGLEGDNAGLFWVPAHLHPELAPGEFRAFLKAHTSSDPENPDAPAGDSPGLARSPSWLARNGSRREGGLGRKRSMLSKQYQPRPGDDAEEEVPPLPSRQRASIYGGRSGEKGLTLQDLQKLEMVMDEADETDNPDQVRSLLRRSLSMNVAPGFLQDDIPSGSDDHGAPLARPPSILRRSARTKIRKAGLAGDGGGHRFAATRKGRMTAAPVIDIPGLEDDDDGANRRRPGSDESEESAFKDSSVDSHDDDDSSERYHDAAMYLEPASRRPSDTSTETDETHIFDAYARDSRSSSVSGSSSRSESLSPSPEGSPPNLRLDLPQIPRSTSGGDWFKDGEKTPTQESVIDPLQRRPSPSDGFNERPVGDRLSGGLHLSVPGEQQYHRTSTSPTSPTTPKQTVYELPPGMAPPAQRTSIHSSSLQTPQPAKETVVPPPLIRPESYAAPSKTADKEKEKEKEKEKKGGFFSSKKDKDKEKDKEKKGKKDKDRFLGSLFGGSKKKQEEPSSVSNFSSAGPAAAAALLGSSKSAKSLGHTPTPSPTSPAFNSYSRYPIHVERAVYRLSHIKLANARRPLYEQVLISNLMFWYLGVIGRNVAEEKKANGEDEKKEAKSAPAKGTPPKPIDVGSAGKPLPREEIHQQPQPIAPASGKKTGLTKPDRSRQPGRDAEAPVRSPSYGMQNAQVDSELRSAGMKGPRPLSHHSHQQPPPREHQPPPALGPQYSQHPQQHPSQHPPQHQPQHPPQHSGPPPNSQQPPYAHLQQQQSRAGSTPPPTHRALSPPGPGQPRPTSDYGMSPSGPRDPRDPRNTDQRSPSPGYPGPPAPNGHAHGMGPSQSMHEMRDTRQRTYSNPVQPGPPAREGSYPPQGGVAGPSQPGAPAVVSGAGMRRVVSEARPPPSLHPQHSGPQPGQIFHHPQSPSFRPSSPGPQPGQRFGPPPGQGHPPPTYGGQPGQIFRPPPGAVRPPQQWEPPQRLPPGANPSEYSVPPHMRRPPPQHTPGQPPQGYDRSYSNPPYHPQQGHPHAPGMVHSQSAAPAPGGYYQAQQGQPRPPPGGVSAVPQFSPYAVPPPPQPGRGVQQPVPQSAGYHHR